MRGRVERRVARDEDDARGGEVEVCGAAKGRDGGLQARAGEDVGQARRGEGVAARGGARGGGGDGERAVEDGVARLADPAVPVAREQAGVDLCRRQRRLPVGVGFVELVGGRDERRAGERDGGGVEVL